MKYPGSALSLFVAMVVCAALVNAAACKKSKDSSLVYSSQLVADIDSAAFHPDSVNAIVTGGFLNITGFKYHPTDTTIIQLSVPASTVDMHTTYSFEDTSVVVYYGAYRDPSYISYNAPSHGTVVIDSIDKVNHIALGSFDGVIYGNDSVAISNGSFTVQYVVQ